MCSLQASILDLHSGALSKGDKFIDIYQWVCDIDYNLAGI